MDIGNIGYMTQNQDTQYKNKTQKTKNSKATNRTTERLNNTSSLITREREHVIQNCHLIMHYSWHLVIRDDLL